MDPNMGVLLATTLKNYQKTLTDNIHKSNAVWMFIKDNDGFRSEDGGERIVEPLMYGLNSTADFYSGYDVLDTTPQTGIDAAEFSWKQAAVSVSISGEEVRKNGGGDRIVNLLDAKVKQAEQSLKQKLTAGLFSSGTVAGNAKAITGLEALVTNSGIYGNIDSTTGNTWWRAGIESTSEALGLAKMRTAFNTASVGGSDTPDLIVTTQTLFESLEGLFTQVSISGGGSNFTTPSAGMKKVADGGFQALNFKGVPVVWDEQCPTGIMYFLNTQHMKVVYHKDANFDVNENVRPDNQDAYTHQILWMGNITCNRRASFYKLTAKT